MSTLKENVHDLFDGWNTIPNWLSFIRIALIPVFAVLFVQGHQLVAVIVMICAALTDLFDGKIARKFNQVSNLGKILDPIADKLSQMAIVIVLLYTYWENPIKYLFFFFIVKEVLMLLGGALLLSARERISRFLQLIFHLIPKRSPFQRLFYPLADESVIFHPIHPKSVSHILEDAFRERVGTLNTIPTFLRNSSTSTPFA